MSKIVIIGGGIAGLTAGIFAQRYGYESEIFESHTTAGGECTGWDRKGFHIDNCIHWLTGTDKNTSLYQLWEDIGALGEGVELIKFDKFYTSRIDGKILSLFRDKELTRKQLIKISPKDSKNINEFIDAVKASESVNMPVEMPADMMPKMQLMKIGMSMIGVIKYMKKYGKMTVGEFADSFKSPILRTFFSDYMGRDYSAFSLIVSYASFTSGNADVPKGGSVEMVKRIVEKYKLLGGVIHTNSPVEKINIENRLATGVTLKSGEVISADYVIPACDTDITFGKLLDRKYMPKQLAENYEKLKVQSAFQVAFGVDDRCGFIENTEIFDCRELTIANSSSKRMSVKNYAYEPSFAPLGKAVLQVHFAQSQEDYEYWENLYKTDKKQYEEKKQEFAEEISLRLSENYQQINGAIQVLDIVTPYTYHRILGAYKGAYMNFVYSPQAMKQQAMTGLTDGLDNVVLATQWQQMPGGLPVAAASGKFAVQRIAE